MAVIRPFCGVRYNPEQFDDLRVVLSQPHDRFDQALLKEYYDLSPYNIARIIRSRAEYSSALSSSPNGYLRARAYYHQWLDEGVLVPDPQPALYLYEQRFQVGDDTYARMGMISAVKLAEFDEGIILPHERTHPGPGADRLRLLGTLSVNAEPIFMLYPDSDRKVNDLLRRAIGDRSPDIDATEMYESAVQQRVWVITDQETIQAIQAAMEPKRNLIIADGHHRYTSSLNYRNVQRQINPDMPECAACNYIAAALIALDDPGLVILPTHREIRNFTDTSPAEILERAKAHFTVTRMPDLDACLSAINADPSGHSYGFYGGAETGFHVLALKDESLIDSLISDDHSKKWKSLAVSVLHKVLLEQVAGVPYHGIESRTMIRYQRNPQLPVDNVDCGKANFVFFLSPTKMEHVKACVANGEIMPQKSTDFYPKVIAGLVLMPIGTDANPE